MIKLCAFADEAGASLSEQIAALKRNGIGLIELRSVGGVNVRDITEREALAYAEELSQADIGVYSIGSPIGKIEVGTDEREYLEVAEHIFKLANIFGAKRVRVFSFFEAYDRRGRVIDLMNSLVRLADRFGLTLCHENEKEIYGDTAERVGDLLDSVVGLRSVYDPANFIQVGEAPELTLPLAKRAEYIHIKDVISATGEIVPAGLGDGRIADIISEIDGDRVLSLEPHLAVFEGYSSIDKTEMKNKYSFTSNAEAFDAAANALKRLLFNAGYKESKGGFTKI